MKIDKEWLLAKAKEVYGPLEDGFQWTDLFEVLPTVMEIVSELKSKSDEEKKQIAQDILNTVIDETDTPWVPDPMIDPWMKKAVPPLVNMMFDKFYK